MVFWIGILAGITFVFLAIKTGFFETWAMLFNIVISVYLGIFLRPMIVELFPTAGSTVYGNTLTILAAAGGAFAILHSTSYIFFTGQFNVPFPKVLDFLGSAFLGFLAGLLVWSFVMLLICTSPISQNNTIKAMGLSTEEFQQSNASYLVWWCDVIHNIVSNQDDGDGAEKLISDILKESEKKTRDRVVVPSEPAEPPETETKVIEKEELGAPPEPEEEF